MKRYLVLLGGGITHDGRVIRFVRSVSRIAEVDLICLDPRPEDSDLFGTNVRIHGLPAYDFRPRGLTGRVLLHRRFDGFVPKARSLGRSWDAVQANDFPTLRPAARIAARTGAKLVYDSHELYLETVNQLYRPRGRVKRLAAPAAVWLARRLGRRVEERLLRRVDLLLTVNESCAAWFAEEYGVADVTAIMNCPLRADTVPEGRLRAELGLAAADRIVLYQGVLNPGRGLVPLVRSAAGYDEGVRLVIVGRGPLESRLRLFAAAPDLTDRVFFRGMVPYDELPRLTASADLGVMILEPLNRSKELSSANKVFEYMAAGVPVLASDFPENRRVVGGSDAGWLVTDRDSSGLARAVNDILADPGEMARREEERLLADLGELLGT